MALKENVGAFAVKQTLSYLDKDWEKSLLEAYQSSLFMGYHDNQPWNDNMLRPCPVLDNPGRLIEIVEKSHGKSTNYQNLESAKEFSNKCVETAEKWAVVADRLWEESIMAKSKLVQANEKIAEKVVGGYKRIEDTVVGGYKKIEEGAVNGFTKMSDAFVDEFLTKDGETVKEAKARLAEEQRKREEARTEKR